MRVGRNLRGIRMILAIHSVKNTLIGVQSRGDLGEDCVIAKKRTSRESYSTVPFRKAKWERGKQNGKRDKRISYDL